MSPILPPQERYTIDVEAVAGQVDQLGIVLDLVAAMQTPNWTQEGACRPCYDWDSGKRARRPNPPRAEDAAKGCAGCTWSFLDGVDTQQLRIEERLLRLRILRESWVKQLKVWRNQSLAYRFDREKKRFVELAEESSLLRYKAKQKELRSCEKLIKQLEKQQTEPIKLPRGRRKILMTVFHNNKPTVEVPGVDLGCPSHRYARKRHEREKAALLRDQQNDEKA